MMIASPSFARSIVVDLEGNLRNTSSLSTRDPMMPQTKNLRKRPTSAHIGRGSSAYL